MKRCKKFGLCLLAVAMVLLCFVTVSHSALAAAANSYKYEYDGEKAGYYITYVYGDPLTGKVELPGSYNNRPIVGIAHGVFSHEEFTSVTIPYGVVDIDYQAFFHCSELRNITIPSTVTHIGYDAFKECNNLSFNIYDNALYLGDAYNPYHALIRATSQNITSCQIHPNTKVIADRAFYPCKDLVSVTIPYGVQTIGTWAFRECTSLTGVIIPNSVTVIGDEAFYGCTGMTSVTVGSGVNKFGEGVFSGCSGITDVTIVKGVTSIGLSAFSGCDSLVNLIIPDSVTTIDYGAFSGCDALTSVTIPNSVQIIEDGAFSGCNSLTSVTIGTGIKKMGAGAFSSDNLKEVHIQDMAVWCKIAFEDEHANPLRPGASLYLKDTLVTELVIPDSITVIPDYAFIGCTGLTSVNTGKNVTGIGQRAFESCTDLASVTMERKVTGIGQNAFLWCTGLKGVYIQDLAAWCKVDFNDSLSNPLYYAGNLYLDGELVTNLVIPREVTSIGAYAFFGCTGLTDIQIPNSVTTIDKAAFSGCTGLTGITLPNSLTTTGNTVFSDCTGLVSVTLPNSITTIGPYTFSGCTALTGITIPDSVTRIDSFAFLNCTGLIEITIPNGVTQAAEGAFSGCTGLVSVTIPDSITGNAAYVFYDCQVKKLIIADGSKAVIPTMVMCKNTLQEVIVSASVTSIDPQAFSGCINLESFQVDERNSAYHSAEGCLIETDRKTLISGCATSQIPTDGSVIAIGDYAFSGRTNMTEITIPNSITAIGNYAFAGCTGLTAFVVPDSVTTVGENLLDGCTGLTSVSIGNGLTSIGAYMFKGCVGLTNIIIPDGVTGIGGGAFCECIGLTEITIPAGVTSIGGSAFAKCTGLTEITIPDGVTSIGGNAFYHCTGLTEVTIPNSVTTIGGWAFDSCKNLTSITLPSKLTSIADNTFRQCESLTSINIPDSVTTIGGYAFASCYSLNGITLPDSITSIGDRAFYQCSRLTSLNIPEGVTDIGEYAFEECSSLAGSLILPDSLTRMGMNAFRGCKGLTDLVIGNGITVIPGNAFSGCTGLTDVTISDSVTTISRNAFAYCTGLTSVIIPDGVTSIDGYAFNNCTGLTSLAIPASVTSIGTYAFDECTSLRTVIFCGTQAQWNAIQKGYNSIPGSKNKLQLHNYKNGVCTICQYCDVSSILSYTINSAGNGYVVTDCQTFANRVLEIPETYNGKPVTGIGENAFAECVNLTGIIIGKDITIIEKNAFAGCTSLAEVFYKGTQEQWTAMDIDSENGVLLNALRHYSCTDANGHWEVMHVEPTCTQEGYKHEICPCGYERNKVTEGAAFGHSWVEATCAAPKTCSVCKATEGSANTDVHILGQWQHVKPATPIASGQQKRSCACGERFETEEFAYTGDGIILTGELAKETTVYINGMPYEVQKDGDGRYVEPAIEGDYYMVTYTYHVGDVNDIHTQYPTGMKVYLVKDGKITHIPELDNLLQYSGASIRITGKKGIRMITSIEKEKKTALTGKGLAGYKLLEYGTALCFADDIPTGEDLVLGRSYTRSNYAYKRGVADPVFATTKDLVQYTNVLVGFSLYQCKDDIAMRPYIILEDAEGEQITLYGGTIYRSIGYIAYQNRTVFKPGTASYNYVWEIIHHVYGDKYDADYKG